MQKDDSKSVGRGAGKASSMAGGDGDRQKKVPMWSGLVSFSVVINTVTKATWRNYSSTSRSITEGKGQEPGAEPRRCTVPGSLAHFGSLGMVPPTVAWDPPISTNNENNSPQTTGQTAVSEPTIETVWSQVIPGCAANNNQDSGVSI